MQFRWVVLLTLWTFLSGPMLALPVRGKSPKLSGGSSMTRPAASETEPPIIR